MQPASKQPNKSSDTNATTTNKVDDDDRDLFVDNGKVERVTLLQGGGPYKAGKDAQREVMLVKLPPSIAKWWGPLWDRPDDSDDVDDDIDDDDDEGTYDRADQRKGGGKNQQTNHGNGRAEGRTNDTFTSAESSSAISKKAKRAGLTPGCELGQMRLDFSRKDKWGNPSVSLKVSNKGLEAQKPRAGTGYGAGAGAGAGASNNDQDNGRQQKEKLQGSGTESSKEDAREEKGEEEEFDLEFFDPATAPPTRIFSVSEDGEDVRMEGKIKSVSMLKKRFRPIRRENVGSMPGSAGVSVTSNSSTTNSVIGSSDTRDQRKRTKPMKKVTVHANFDPLRQQQTKSGAIARARSVAPGHSAYSASAPPPPPPPPSSSSSSSSSSFSTTATTTGTGTGHTSFASRGIGAGSETSLKTSSESVKHASVASQGTGSVASKKKGLAKEEDIINLFNEANAESLSLREIRMRLGLQDEQVKPVLHRLCDMDRGGAAIASYRLKPEYQT